MKVIEVKIKCKTPAEKAFKAFMAEKKAKRLEQEKKAIEYASKLKKPAL